MLITGASKGIGSYIATGYAQAGAQRIALCARTLATETASAVRKAAKDAGRLEPNVLVLEMDVCDKSSVEASAKRVEAEWGRLDILVNNAGHMAEFASLLDVDEEDYMRAWDVNYWGVFRTTKAFLPLMLKGGDKTIVNLSSVAAHYAGVGGGAYHVSKFALARFTECVQDEYGPQVSLGKTSPIEGLGMVLTYKMRTRVFSHILFILAVRRRTFRLDFLSGSDVNYSPSLRGEARCQMRTCS